MKRMFVENFCLGTLFLIIGCFLIISDYFRVEIFPEYLISIFVIFTIVIIGFMIVWEKKKEKFSLDDEVLQKVSQISFQRLVITLFLIFQILALIKINYNYYIDLKPSYLLFVLGICYILRFFCYVYYKKRDR